MAPPGEWIEKCEEPADDRGEPPSCTSEEVPGPDSRAYVHEVKAGSPAEEAGIIATDVVVRVDDTPVYGTMDVIRLMQGRKAGQPFTVLLERDGAPLTLHGKIGIVMSDHTCGVATPERLAAARTPDIPRLVPFKLMVRAPGSRLTWNCLEGCGTHNNGAVGIGSNAAEEASHECVFRLTQDQSDIEILPACTVVR